MTSSDLGGAKMAPLSGLKVVELARILAGPWAGQILADLGAEVIKIESPNGDDTRRWGPPFVTHQGEKTAAYFHGTNRGKTSVCLDFTNPDDLAELHKILAQADVVIENFKVGGLVKYGLDYGQISQKYPRLVYCSITGFGQTGPYAQRPGYDFVIQGMSGLMSITGAADGPPQKVGVAVTDVFTGIYASTAILAAIHQRNTTGRGQQIDMSLLDVATAITANQAMNYLSTGDVPGRMGNAHPNLMPYQEFPVADGHILIAVGNDSQFARFVSVLGRPDLAENPRYATNAARVAARAELEPILAELCQNFTKSELLEACEASTVPAGPINDIGEVFDDPQIKHRGLEIAPEGVRSVRSPMRFSDATLPMDRAAPTLNNGKKP